MADVMDKVMMTRPTAGIVFLQDGPKTIGVGRLRRLSDLQFFEKDGSGRPKWNPVKIFGGLELAQVVGRQPLEPRLADADMSVAAWVVSGEWNEESTTFEAMVQPEGDPHPWQ